MLLKHFTYIFNSSNSLVISQLKRKLNVHIWTDFTRLDEVFAVASEAINVKVQIFDSSAENEKKLLIFLLANSNRFFTY